jgi:hypothetical protein
VWWCFDGGDCKGNAKLINMMITASVIYW